MTNTTNLHKEWYSDDIRELIKAVKSPACIEIIGQKGAGRRVIADQITQDINPDLHIRYNVSRPFNPHSSLEDLAHAFVKGSQSKDTKRHFLRSRKLLNRYLKAGRPVNEWKGIFRALVFESVDKYSNPLVEIIFANDLENSDDLSIGNEIVTRYLLTPGVSVVSTSTMKWIHVSETVNYNIFQLPEIKIDRYIEWVKERLTEYNEKIAEIFSQFDEILLFDRPRRRWSELIASVEYPNIEDTDRLLRYIAFDPGLNAIDHYNPDSAIQNLFEIVLSWEFPYLSEVLNRNPSSLQKIKKAILDTDSSEIACLPEIGISVNEKQIIKLKRLFMKAFSGDNPLVLPFEESAKFDLKEIEEIKDRITKNREDFEAIGKVNSSEGDKRQLIRAAINEYRNAIRDKIIEQYSTVANKQNIAISSYFTQNISDKFFELVKIIFDYMPDPLERSREIKVIEDYRLNSDPYEFLPEQFKLFEELVLTNRAGRELIMPYKEALHGFLNMRRKIIKEVPGAVRRPGLVEKFSEFGIKTGNPLIMHEAINQWKALIDTGHISLKENKFLESFLNEAKNFVENRKPLRAFVSWQHADDKESKPYILSKDEKWWAENGIKLVGDQRLFPQAELLGQNWEINVYRHLPRSSIVVIPRPTPDYFLSEGVKQELELIEKFHHIGHIVIIINCRDGDIKHFPDWMQNVECVITVQSGQNRSETSQREAFRMSLIEKAESLRKNLLLDVNGLLLSSSELKLSEDKNIHSIEKIKEDSL
ncbi:MAG: hypothetical protein PVF32_20735 [Desulfobacterales bacterium]|jgi:hypothetical protein